uniref:Ribosomal protein S7 n=1 Tax=Pterocladiophila hemisphaerica TaxID=2712948 RepID=A0A6M3WWB6_9FLOR|nr:ribosomal protein S7 [Pterocladiophila hemisphaerica]
MIYCQKKFFTQDPVYNSILVQMLIIRILKKGNKNIAQKIVYKALNSIKEQTGKKPITILEQAILNSMPLVELKNKRIGNSIYKIPLELRSIKKISLGLKWIIDSSKNKKGHAFYFKLAQEILDCFNNQGSTIRKKQEMHQIAHKNKTFSYSSI